ncbi:hypothetical protein [Thiocapsa marina]|uniref:Uncharacterized protein n=1 Tax=Thiocapsa marina 5811 TaxID=768671 RepID=F9UC52_9GAMM|nr:hypothetical protein [Thiocapsa marina]EGV17965.1 hypothetical protein ThimaDRAFT_2504 [Thiocapsa marina 5811]
MKRRTFIHAMGAAGALGLSGQWTLAEAVDRAASVQPLTPVFDRLPSVLAAARAQPSPGFATLLPDGTDPSLAARELLEDWDTHLHPLVIALGPAAERILDRLPERIAIPADCALYRTGSTQGHHAAEALALRLDRCASALLLIDPSDDRARRDAPIWTRHLAASEVYLRAAVVLDTPADGLDPDWRASLDGPVIEVGRACGDLDTAALIEAMLPGLPFFQPAMICCDPVDVNTILASGPRARTTAVRWTRPDERTAAIADACADLVTTRSQGALGWLNTDLQFTIDEWDVLNTLLTERLPPNADLLLIPFPDSTRGHGERVLSLTVVGD